MIEGIPDGWELVRIGEIQHSEFFIHSDGSILQHNENTNVRMNKNYVVIRKIEKPKQYRPFANAAEYVANRREGFAVDWKTQTDLAPGFFAVVSANEMFVWVAFGEATEKLDWEEAFESLQFRHVDNSTSPFGIEVTE